MGTIVQHINSMLNIQLEMPPHAQPILEINFDRKDRLLLNKKDRHLLNERLESL